MPHRLFLDPGEISYLPFPDFPISLGVFAAPNGSAAKRFAFRNFCLVVRYDLLLV